MNVSQPIIRIVCFCYCVCFCLSSVQAQESEWFFQTPSDDLYLIDNPFADPSSVWVEQDRGIYQPCYLEDQNQFLVMGFEGERFQLKQDDRIPLVLPTNMWEESLIRQKRIYRHSVLYDSLATDNWLTAMMRKKSKFRDTLQIDPMAKDSGASLTLHFLNFYLSEEPNQLYIQLNGERIDTLMAGFGQYEFKLDFETDSTFNDQLQIEFESQNGAIALVGYELDYMPKAINYQRGFRYYPKLPKQTQLALNDTAFYHLRMEQWQLQLVAKGERKAWTQGLLVKRKNQIETLEVEKGQLAQRPEERVDVLLVYHHRFEKALDTLVHLYQRLRPDAHIETIDVRQIYNQYSFGNKSAEALKACFEEWLPGEVCLLGDANASEHPLADLIPAFYFKQSMKNTRVPTDHQYTVPKRKKAPAFPIGRLPFLKEKELLDYVYKVDQFITRKTDPSCLLLYDDNEIPVASTAITESPLVTYVRPDTLVAMFEKNVVKWMNSSDCSNVMYYGHGSISGWREQHKVDLRMFDELKEDRSFLLFDLSCLTGEFAYPYRKSFSEELLCRKNGPVAIVGASGFIDSSTYGEMITFMINKVKQDGPQPIGELLKAFKLAFLAKRPIDDLGSIQILGLPALVFKLTGDMKVSQN